MQRTIHMSECCTSRKARICALSGNACTLTSPVKHRRIFKCCIIISHFGRNCKRFLQFFSYFAKTPRPAAGFFKYQTANSGGINAERRLCQCKTAVPFICLRLLRRTDRTGICASAAVQTGICVDHILAVALGNCACRTGICASTALDASIADCICHNCYLLLSKKCGFSAEHYAPVFYCIIFQKKKSSLFSKITHGFQNKFTIPDSINRNLLILYRFPPQFSLYSYASCQI